MRERLEKEREKRCLGSGSGNTGEKTEKDKTDKLSGTGDGT